MSLDRFDPCPCGSGKKVKFCCSADIVDDLQKAIRSLEGEQRLAAIEQLDRILAKHPGRAAPLALKAAAQIQLGELSAAEETVLSFLQAAPGNPVALSQSAMLDAAKGHVESAVGQLQRALAASSGPIALTVYEAIGVVAEALLLAGDVVAARGHLFLQMGIGGVEHSPAAETLMRINSSPHLSLLLKEDFSPGDRPEGAAWGEKFDAAMGDAGRGAWAKACDKLAAIAEEHPGQAPVLKTLAVLRGWLGQGEASAKAWRRYAAVEGLPLDEAVEAEAIAQISTDEADDEIDVVNLVFPVADTEKLMERLLSDRRAAQVDFNAAQFASDDEPPPKAAFLLLDRELPQTGVGLAREQAPQILGEMFVYGKQTDRGARVELVARRNANFAAAKSAAADLFGELAGAVEKEETIDTVSTVSDAISTRWRLPDDTPPETRTEFVAQQRRDSLLKRWPQIKLGALAGKTPAEAAKDFKLRVRVLAAVLNLELSFQQQRWPFDANELREELGLPKSEPIDPQGLDVRDVSLARLARLQLEKLPDDDIVVLLQRASLTAAMQPLYNLAVEVIRRGGIKDKFELPAAYGLLARTAQNPGEAVEALQKAQETVAAAGQSPARYLIDELNLHIQSGAGKEVERVLRRLQSRHMEEPGVGQAVMQLLAAYGIISPEGGPMPPSAALEPAAAGAPAAAPGKVFVPGEQAAPAGGEQKSKLWLPGMD